MSRVVHIDDEVNARIAKACVQHLADYVEVFGIEVESDLTQSWKSTDLCCFANTILRREKLAWTVYLRHAKRLNHFHTSCLRKLLKIKWQDGIPDTEVLKRAGIQTENGTVKMDRPGYQNA